MNLGVIKMMEEIKKSRYTEAQKRATEKYHKARATLHLVVENETKEQAQARAEQLGLSLTQYVSKLIKDDLEE